MKNLAFLQKHLFGNLKLLRLPHALWGIAGISFMLPGCSAAPSDSSQAPFEEDETTPSASTPAASPSPEVTPEDTPLASPSPEPTQTPEPLSISGTIDGQTWSAEFTAFHILQDIYRQDPNPGGGTTSKASAIEEPDDSYSYWTLSLFDFARSCEDTIYTPEKSSLNLTLHFAQVSAVHSCGVDLNAATLDDFYQFVNDWEELAPQDLIAEGWGRAYDEENGWGDEIAVQSGTLEVRFLEGDEMELRFDLVFTTGETLKGHVLSSSCPILYGSTVGDACGGQPF